MNRKVAKQQRKRLRRLFDAWLTPLGLRWWSVNIVYHRRTKGFRLARDRWVFGRASADWRYLTAQIDVCLPAARLLSDAEAERAVVHELTHILIREACDPTGVSDHEERVCTTLAQAFLWVRGLGVSYGD